MPSTTTFNLSFKPMRTHLTATLTLLALALLVSIYTHSPSPQQLTLHKTRLPTTSPIPRIIKATILYPPSNAITTHSLARHASHGYAIRILHTPIVRGYTNVLIWLHHLIVQELLARDGGAEWILYFDTSTTLLNNAHIPLHTFLPRGDTFPAVCVIATKRDHAVLGSEVFFVRVHALSLRIVGLALAGVYDDDGQEQGQEGEWDTDGVGAALERVFGREGYGDKVVYQPVEWYDGLCAVFVRRGEGVEGLMEMKKGMEGSGSGRGGEVCPGPQEVEEFWDALVEAKQVLSEAEGRGHTRVEGEFMNEVREVRYWVEVRSWDSAGVRRSVAKLKEKLGIGEVVGFEMVVG